MALIPGIDWYQTDLSKNLQKHLFYVILALNEDRGISKCRWHPEQNICLQHFLVNSAIHSQSHQERFRAITRSSSPKHDTIWILPLETCSDTSRNVFCLNAVNPIVLFADQRVKNLSTKRSLCLWHAASPPLLLGGIYEKVSRLDFYSFNPKLSFANLLGNLSKISRSFEIFLLFRRFHFALIGSFCHTPGTKYTVSSWNWVL